ncbi:S41 family peptidase [Deinococcus cavernae]|nr:S41 family peptidase [Deinococcus cavernae]
MTDRDAENSFHLMPLKFQRHQPCIAFPMRFTAYTSEVKRLSLSLLLLLAAEPAQASPATDLFRAATSVVQREYYGWASADLNALIAGAATSLDAECAPQADTCPFETGRAALTNLFERYGDAHTNVRTPEAAQRLREAMQDLAVPRTGARTVRAEGGLLVVSVIAGSPAEQAGLRRFDLLPTVDGQRAGQRDGQNAEIGPNEFMRLERRAKPITVTRRRAGRPEDTLQLGSALLRARDEPTLLWADDQHGTALIDLPSFLTAGTARRFLNAVQQARQQGARQLVIDLRFNGGGSLSECVMAASVFGPVIYRSQDRWGQFSYYGLRGGRGDPASTEQAASRPDSPSGEAVWSGPAAVLVGPNTASCAEVFSHYARQAGVKVVGEETKGVGNSGVQFHDLPDGGLVAVTVLKAFDADQHPLPPRLAPDVTAPLSIPALTGLGRDTTLEAALQTLSQAVVGSPH